jgi:hypothetical protein
MAKETHMIGLRRTRFRIALALASLIASPIGAATTAAPASATDGDHYVHLETSYNGDGKAEADVTFAWGDATTVLFRSVVQDLCPGDGHGAYVSMHVRYMDGTVQWKPVGKDTDGCDSGYAFSSGTVTDGKRIRNIYFLLAEKEGDTGQTYDVDTSGTFDNPYTG